MHVSSFGGVSYTFNVAYGAGKAGVDKLAKDMAIELRKEGIGSLALYPGVVRTERMEGLLDGGDWKQKTGLASLPQLVESPVFTGRVAAAVYREAQEAALRLKRSGDVCVVAELAKELGVVDVSGARPPSLRSLRFLIPSVVLGRMASHSQELEDLLLRVSPDILLPMSIMVQGPPESAL